MTDQGWPAYLRPCTPEDDAFLAVVFSSTWEDQVAALPDQSLAPHVLRIQHIAQERKYQDLYPGHLRYIVECADGPAGRLYLQQRPDVLHIVDLTLMPAYRSTGVGSQIVRDLCARAAPDPGTVTLRVPRLDERGAALARRLGFHAAAQDDLETLFECTAGEPA